MGLNGLNIFFEQALNADYAPKSLKIFVNPMNLGFDEAVGTVVPWLEWSCSFDGLFCRSLKLQPRQLSSRPIRWSIKNHEASLHYLYCGVA